MKKSGIVLGTLILVAFIIGAIACNVEKVQSETFNPCSYDTDGDTFLSKGETLGAVNDYFDGLITKEQALEVVNLYFSPIDVCPLPLLKVHFIDVGQGGSILLDLGETEVLIDGGGRSSDVAKHLEDYVDGSLEAMIATHPHADHIGGLIAVLDTFQVDQIWHNDYGYDSNTYRDFKGKVNTEGAEVNEAKRGVPITVGDLTFKVLHPAESLDSKTNNNSIILYLKYGETEFLFTGDAEQEAEASMAVAGILADIDILKVGHHGSRTSSSPAFLDIIQPEEAIIMVGANNQYGHPHDETISRLEDIGAKVWRTDVQGTIVVTTDGQDYTVEPKPTPSPTPTPTPTPTPSSSSTPTVTPTPTSSPSPTPPPTTSPPSPPNVQIVSIFYNGLVYRVQSDEYVEIKNLGGAPQDLEGWVLKDISEGYPSFTFPSYILQPGETIRVYTNEIHPESGGFSFGYGKAIWQNSPPHDWAALFNTEGIEVSRRSY